MLCAGGEPGIVGSPRDIQSGPIHFSVSPCPV
ncbi:protein of unknown function (plasmid) [Cupriavidus neocaledonicus]|uniref:Uncharacterized protein n=1 Tax=Cupriavidus neocaledonicus TaxID=1040979 RepID=A0A375HUV0_9BURK|nr:protein of unknown function [Cupriavidus neocaledonicus]